MFSFSHITFLCFTCVHLALHCSTSCSWCQLCNLYVEVPYLWNNFLGVGVGEEVDWNAFLPVDHWRAAIGNKKVYHISERPFSDQEITALKEFSNHKQSLWCNSNFQLFFFHVLVLHNFLSFFFPQKKQQQQQHKTDVKTTDLVMIARCPKCVVGFTTLFGQHLGEVQLDHRPRCTGVLMAIYTAHRCKYHITLDSIAIL